MKADGSVIIDTKMNNDALEKGFERLKNDCDSLGITCEKAGDKIKAAFADYDVSANIQNAVAKLEQAQNKLQIATDYFDDAVAMDDDKSAESWARKREAAYTQVENAQRRLTQVIAAEANKQAAEEEKAQIKATKATEREAAKKKKAQEKAYNDATKGARKFANRFSRILSGALIFNALSSGLRQLTSYFGAALKKNSEFAASFAQLKGAFLTAVQPIYEVVAPVLTYLMRLLTAVLQSVSRFISLITGKSTSQMAENAKNLYDQANAMEAAGNAAEEAKKQIMGFDEINKLDDSSSSSSGGGSGTSDISPDFTLINEERLQKIADLVALIGAGFALWKIGSSIGGTLGNLISKLGLVLAAVGGILLAIDGITDAWNNGVDWGNAAEILAGVAIAGGALYAAFGNVAAGIVLVVGGIATVVTAFHDMMESGMNLQNTLLLIGGTIAAGLGISLLVGSWVPLVIAAIASVLAAIVYFTGHGGELIDSLKTLCSGFIEFITGVFTGNWEQAWNGMVNVGRGAVNALISVVNSLLSLVTAAVNKLFELLSFNINIPGIGAVSLNLPTYSAPQIPYLAQGAVLPANKPFLAVVGDQKNGTNVEAPLETIKQAVAEVLAQNGATGQIDVNVTFEGSESQLIRYLTPKITVQQRRAERAVGG